MKSKINFFVLFLGLIYLVSNNFKYALNAHAEDLLKVETKKELEKGNFLIGLKQYLGGKNDIFSNDNSITFKAENSFLNLYSSNGIKYKSKKINIIWKDIPIKTPYVVKRFVFGPYASYESAQKQAITLKEKGYRATVAYPKNWEVWIPFEDKENFLEDKNYKTFTKLYKTQITPFLKNSYSFQQLQGPIFITAEEDIKINDVNFGKHFYLIQDSYGTWTLIQKIKFDDYLEGVLPHEIGLNSHLEALKAQAVIARTWGIFNSERFTMDNYHLCVSTQCQVYKPPKTKNKRVIKAIKETSDMILTYKNNPVNSFYHGSNGGISAKASESWKIPDYPYFKTEIDGPKSLRNLIKLPIDEQSKLKQFFGFKKAKFYGHQHSLFRWNKNVSSDLIEENLINKKLIENDTKVSDIRVLERGLSGRVTKLEIKSSQSSKNILLIKDDIRRILSFLPSNLFTIDKLNDNLWFFEGAGFGHGVGLSQSGAIEMAEQGFTYQQILNHYYKGTKLKKIEIFSQS